MKLSSKVIVSSLTFILVILIAGFIFLVHIGWIRPSFTQNSPADNLRSNCRDLMSQGACVIMHNSAYLPKEVKQVYLAGFGQMNADTYRSLQTNGILMCDQIRDACNQNAESEICRFGKSAYGTHAN